MRELIIDKKTNIETICLVEDEKLIEIYQNNSETDRKKLEGNIYIGKVTNVIQGMQAAFVDYGDEKKGFIYYKDAIPQKDQKNEEVSDYANGDIREILKVGQKILIQVKKDTNDKKGAKISTHITIPSKYVALMPDTEIITISQKIEEGERKEELLKLARENITKGNGIIIRTSALEASNEQIIKDIDRCIKKWNKIKEKYESSDEIQMIGESETIQEKIILDLDLNKVITNSKEEFEKIKKMLQEEEIRNVRLELKVTETLINSNIQKQLEKISERKIWLNCGGFITIDKTEALTAIDVNTGKYTGNKDLETTVYKVNKEATIEIAKQIRIRDIGGIIIIDYIDMNKDEDKEKIEQLLKDELKKDRAKTQVEGFTKLDLMEMTRKHICSHLD